MGLSHSHGLLGKYLLHSFSPTFFAQKFKLLCPKRNFSYGCFEVADTQGLVSFIDSLRQSPACHGVNVTSPYKESVLPYLDALDPLAEQIGAVNLILRKSSTCLVGYNTDYHGFFRHP